MNHRLMPPVDRVVTLLMNTPGVVSDEIFSAHGCTSADVSRARRGRGLTIVRVKRLGYRLQRDS